MHSAMTAGDHRIWMMSSRAAPANLHVPRTQQHPMTIQLPPPGRARVRAARLATGMTTHGGDRAVRATVPAGTEEELRLTVG